MKTQSNHEIAIDIARMMKKQKIKPMPQTELDRTIERAITIDLDKRVPTIKGLIGHSEQIIERHRRDLVKEGQLKLDEPIRKVIIKEGIEHKKLYDWYDKLLLPDGDVVQTALDYHTTVDEEKILPGGYFAATNSLPTFEQVVNCFKHHLVMNESAIDALRIVFAVVLSTYIIGEPIWLHLVAASGYMKTTLLLVLKKLEPVVFKSSLTTHVLMSGFKIQPDPSLLPRLRNRIFVIKDFTVTLDMDSRDRNTIYSTLRDAYDGSCEKDFGNGVKRKYDNLHFSMLTGTTFKIEADHKASLGERFLKYIIEDPHHDEILRMARKNVGKKERIDYTLAAVAGNFLANKIILPWYNEPKISQAIEDRIIALVQIVAKLRADVEHEGYGERIIKYEPKSEVATRLTEVFIKLGLCLALVDDKDNVDEDTYIILQNVAFSTCIQTHLKIVDAIISQGKCNITTICERTNFGRDMVQRILDDLRVLNVVTRSGQKRSVEYSLEEDVKKLWEKAII